MFNFLTRARVLWVLLPLALLATANSNAEPMEFSYTFVGRDDQTFSAGAVLTGTIDGTIDSIDPDIVYVNSFGPVRFIRPGLPIFNYRLIDSTEFNTLPPGQISVMSFSGDTLDFRSCPGGFIFDTDGVGGFDDCLWAFDPGGGFGISYNVNIGGGGFASAADGTGDTPPCSDPNGPAGCRATDTPIHAENWSLRRFELVLALDFSNEIFNKPGSTRTLKKGTRTYQEFPLLHAVGGGPIGLYRFHAVSTVPKKVDRAGWYGNESFHIFGEGVIEGISAVDRSVPDDPVVGSIIGGTGRYAGASGEYFSDDLVTYFFTFEKAH